MLNASKIRGAISLEIRSLINDVPINRHCLRSFDSNESIDLCSLARFVTPHGFVFLFFNTDFIQSKTFKRSFRFEQKPTAVCRVGFLVHFENISKVALGNGKE